MSWRRPAPRDAGALGRASLMEGVLLRLRAACGAPLLAGALCEAGAAGAAERALRGLGALCLTPLAADPYGVDLELARALGRLCGREVLVAGAVVRLPGAPLVTGGVLGDPHSPAESAGGGAELLDCGLLLWTRPEGPGFAADCSRARAEAIGGMLEPMEDAAGRFAAARDALEGSASRFLLVCDGSGPGAFGAVALKTAEGLRQMTMED